MIPVGFLILRSCVQIASGTPITHNLEHHNRERKKQKVWFAVNLVRDLLQWYDDHARVLPWRVFGSCPHDPYTVWVSEIMLQQTTVATVKGYFPRFIASFPTVHALANASLDEVLTCWQGLGYYRRARLMHRCAQEIVAHHNGIFPHTWEALRALPGIGPYTAGAILAIAFQKRAIALDGNVKRVLKRFLRHPISTGDSALNVFLEALTPHQRCGDFVQALMELGATVCTPRVPLCSACPWQLSCKSAQNGFIEVQSSSSLAKLQRYGAVYVLWNQDHEIRLEKRPTEGLLGGLYGLPTSSWDHQPPALWDPPYDAQGLWHSQVITHIFTHFKLTLRLFCGHILHDLEKEHPQGVWVSQDNIGRYPLPTLFKKVLKYAQPPLSVGP